MSRKGENIYKRKDGRWEGRMYYKNCSDQTMKYESVYGATYSEVKEKLFQKRISAKAKETQNERENVLFSTILDAWLSSLTGRVKESTYARYYQLVNKHIRPTLGKFPMKALTTRTIEEFIQEQSMHGKLPNHTELSSKMVLDLLSVLRLVLKYADLHGEVVACNTEYIQIKHHPENARTLTDIEQKKLIRVLLRDIDFCKFGVCCPYTPEYELENSVL